MPDQLEIDEEERRKRRAQRVEELKKQKERQARFRKNAKYYAMAAGIVFLAALLIVGSVTGGRKAEANGPEASQELALDKPTAEPENLQESTPRPGTEEVPGETDGPDTIDGPGEPDEPEITDEPGETDIDDQPEKTDDPQNAQEPEESPAPTAKPRVAEAVGPVQQSGKVTVGEVKFEYGYTAAADENTLYPDEEQVTSQYSVLIDETTNTIIAQRGAEEIISPASMTKILTLLVAAERITDLDDTFTITIDITDYAYVHDCSAVGFSVEETVTVRDLLYGTILPSGGDAALALAIYVAGSQEAFVELMNDKLAELGLSDTAHFTNCIGLYDEDHYCSVYDMAMIMKAAVQNDLCREVLSAHTYTTSQTEAHPEGIQISNWFLRRIEDKDTGGLVLCAKTGFVNQSGCCAVSYQISDSGVPYICVTADTYSSWRCIYDHVAMYSLYAD